MPLEIKAKLTRLSTTRAYADKSAVLSDSHDRAMSQTIYPSLEPSVKISPASIFTYLFDPDEHGNIGKYPGSSPAFIDAETSTTISRATLRSLALSLAYGLTSPSGPLSPLRKGDTVLIFSPNSMAYPVVVFGAVAAGLRCTFANSAYTANELKHQWTDSGAKLIFAHPSLVPIVTEMFKQRMGWTDDEVRRSVIVASAEWLTGAKDEGRYTPFAHSCMGLTLMSGAGTTQLTNSFTQLPALLNRGSLVSETKFTSEKDLSETVYLCYSSGTTGQPKGVEVYYVCPVCPSTTDFP